MPTTLTERYIAEAISGIPATTRNDVEAELNVSIADAIEARTDRGEELANAEKAVLTDLGDPGVLAARYSDRPLYLIGPGVYLTWWRLPAHHVLGDTRLRRARTHKKLVLD